MKIVFNLPTSINYFQIYDELSKNENIEVILPDNYKDFSKKVMSVDLDALERAVRSSDNIDYILGFEGELPELIKWRQRKIDVPIIIYLSNIVNRPSYGLLSLYTNIWYVEKYAGPLMKKYNLKNIVFAGMAANQYIFKPLNIEKKYDIGFFGQFYGERKYWLSTLIKYSKRNNIKTHFLYGHTSKIRLGWEDLNEIYNQNKINLSFAPLEPGGRIVNMRTFEICMTGTLQLMEYTPCLEDYFEIDEEVVCWRNKKDLLEKLTYYTENDDEREKIAKRGFNRAIKNHTWSKRAEEIYQFIKKKQRLSSLGKSKIKNHIFQLPEKYKSNIQLKSIESLLSEVIKPYLVDLAYKKRSFKQEDGFIINLKKRKIKFKPNLDDIFFVKIYGKIMILIRILPQNKDISEIHWNRLKKIRKFVSNYNYDFPDIGIITNGKDLLVRDFKTKNWLNSIPNYKELKKRVKFSDQLFFRLNYYLNKAKLFSFIFTIPYNEYFFKVYYKLPSLDSILTKSSSYKKLKYLVKSGILNMYEYGAEIKLITLLEKHNIILNNFRLKNKED